MRSRNNFFIEKLNAPYLVEVFNFGLLCRKHSACFTVMVKLKA
jgi:hypothetical protein